MEISKNEICRERSQLRMHLWLATMRFHVSSSARQHDVNTLVDRTRSQLFERRVPNRTCTDPSYTTQREPDHMPTDVEPTPTTPTTICALSLLPYRVPFLAEVPSTAGTCCFACEPSRLRRSPLFQRKNTKNDHETGAPQRYASPSRREREKLRCGSRRPNPSVMKGASVSVALVTSAPPGKETDGDTSACQVFALLRKPNIEPLPTIIYNR
jgi:hypothetical protein